MSKIVEWFWSWLPDKCEVDNCSRRGIRDNENVVAGRFVCDHCHAKMLYYRELNK